MTERAQSEVVGVVLMTAVVVLAVTAVGVYYLDDAGGDRPGAAVGVRASVAPGSVALAHDGGAALVADATRVIVRVDGTTAVDDSLAGAPDSSISGDGDDRFEPGERWTWTNPGAPFDDDANVHVTLVDNRSNAVVFDDVRNPGDGAAFRRWAPTRPISTDDEPPIDKPK